MIPVKKINKHGLWLPSINIVCLYNLFYSILAHLQHQKIPRECREKNFNHQLLTFHKVSKATHCKECVLSKCEKKQLN